VLPLPGRTRDQALLLAQQVAAEAARDPGAFAELARRYSEDLPSRDEGGALGSLSASQLSSWPQVLDAFASMRPGQTSNVVETRYGFHIFRRREPPPEQLLSGSHIVIGHDRADWLKVQARGPLPSRSREEALALATDLYQLLQAYPERFSDLVERYSEHRDAVLQGDFGSWSTREPNPFPLRMRRLEQLAVGEVGAPVESHLGFEIVLRTEERPREQYAARVARLPFNDAAPDDADDSLARVRARADALALSYASEPQRFNAPGELPANLLQWRSGRGVPAVERQLQGLELGMVSASSVQAEFAFQIFQRIAPEPAVPHYETELPVPARPDVAYHASQMAPAALRELLLESGRLAASELASASPVQLKRLRKLHERASFPVTSEPSEVGAALERVLEQTRTLLGPEGYGRYFSALERQLASVLLGAAGQDSIAERGL
jgi:hypothetical protein